MTAHAVANEPFLDITITTFASAAEPDYQRGRKRRRSPPGGSLEAPAPARQQIPSGESAVFRGRCRYRSTSRLDVSRNVSRVRGTSLSPTRKRFLQVLQLNQRQRSQSPSRSRSAHHHARAPQDTPKRRRQRTRSRCRKHEEAAAAAAAGDFVIDEPLPIIWHDYLEQQHDIVIRSEISPTNQKQQVNPI
ncbi:hypothetical protein SLS62_003874 [Diatrype stigma]|uniref:Uncharacterized protein n=1 Tax=Diatrype stigma TaxID=117547 RepID=A0AAN9URJ5_9PEZI